ncbi:MAG: nitroreductase family protein [Bacillota bacterium]
MRAPTAALEQFYSILRLQDPAKRDEFTRICGHHKVVENALLFVFLADFRRNDHLAQVLGGVRVIHGYTALALGLVDATLAAQNLSLAAESLGLGTCYIRMALHRALAVCQALDLPRQALPLFGLAVGHPDQQPQLRPRLDLGLLVHTDVYRDPATAELERAIEDLGNASMGELPVHRSPQEKRLFLKAVLGGAWWRQGETGHQVARAWNHDRARSRAKAGTGLRSGIVPCDPGHAQLPSCRAV